MNTNNPLPSVGLRAQAATLRSLANTARILAKNPHLLQLRLVRALSESPNATIMLSADPNARPVKPN
ncbi:MAG: hypothetical protein HUU60_05915 [Armatimonadetes bacterium]|nr:hypothetical protein [Armatimonadota bacterium]